MALSVSGAGGLRTTLERAAAQVDQAVRKAVGDEGRAIRSDERAAVPVDTGALRDGIDVRSVGDGVQVGVFDTALVYAIWIEWGRSSASAQPFATPAAERSRSRFPRRIADDVRRALP